MRFAPALPVLVALVAFCGCDGRPDTIPIPTGPSAPAPLPPVAPTPPGFGSLRATVTMTAITPAPGATVFVRDCPPGPAGTFTTLCTDQLKATFSVFLDGEAPDSTLRVVFSDGTRQCGSSWLPRTPLVAGTSMTISTTTVFLSSELSEGEGSPSQLVQPCNLPVTTSRIVLQLWQRGNALAPLVAQEFAGTYTFVRP